MIVPSEHLVPAREGTAVPEPAKEPAPVPRPAQPTEERRPKLVARQQTGDPAGDPAPGAPELPRRPRKERVRQAGNTAPETPPRSGSGDVPGRPALPERVPQTHIAQRLREPRADEPVGRDAATPEEVADAWADYEDSTRQVELELRGDQS
ncbi:hypothetical protein [Streptomyces cinnamoneus]|uniref:hypothetical protein n=1 Tax=Streptomyces cinnamoneus TaxID=53446 RepID=UPI001865A0D7|nr:hypothetical protein [Streptomyces cinnamoneus]